MEKFVMTFPKYLRSKMEKVKRTFHQLLANNLLQKQETSKYDQIITIEEVDGRTYQSNIEKKKIMRRFGFFIDFLFCCIVTVLWITALSFFITLNPENGKVNSQDFFFYGYCALVILISVIGIHFDSLILRGFERFTPKIAVILRKTQTRRMFIIRLKLAGNKEFIETETDETKLTLNDFLNLCSKELKIEREKIVMLYKIPETRIRSDADIRRFRRLEYIEVYTIS